MGHRGSVGWSVAVFVLGFLMGMSAAPAAALSSSSTAGSAAAADVRIQLDIVASYEFLTPGTILQFEVFGTAYDAFAYSLDGGPWIELPIVGSGTTGDGQIVQFYSLDTSGWSGGMRVLRVAALSSGTEVASQMDVFFIDAQVRAPLDTFDVAIVLIGFDDDPNALRERLPAHLGTSTQLTPNPSSVGFVDIRYDYDIEVASSAYYAQFLTDVRDAATYRADLEARLNLAALEDQRSTGIARDIFDPLSGYEIPADWLADYVATRPPTPGLDRADFVYYLVNLAPMDAATGSDHWYVESNPDTDTGAEQDWWRLEWDNELNTPIGYPLNTFGGRDHRVFVDPTAYEWYLDWTWIWWQGGTGRAPYSLQYEEVNPGDRTGYLAEILTDLSYGLSSTLPWGPPEESHVRIQDLVLVGSSTQTPDTLGWVVHDATFLGYLRSFMTLKTWDIDSTIANVAAYGDLSAYVDSVTTWDGTGGSIDGLAVWAWLYDHKAEFMADDSNTFEILSVSFVYDDRSMVYAGDRFTGLGGLGISAIFLQTDRLFYGDGTPQKGLTNLVAHEAGHSLGYVHQFGFEYHPDFVQGSMGYFHDGLAYGTFWEDALWRTYVHAKWLDVLGLLAGREPIDLSQALRGFYEDYQALAWNAAYGDLLAIEESLSGPPPPPPPPSIAFLIATNGNGLAVSPDGSTVSTGITFSFGASDPSAAAGFVCALDGIESSCSTPWSYTVGTGGHTFTVRALNAAGDPGPLSSFAWTVLTPAQAVTALKETVVGMSLSVGARNSLLDPLRVAYNLLTNSKADDDLKACRQLDSFVSQVALYRQKGRLTLDQAQRLSIAADEIEIAVGCP